MRRESEIEREKRVGERLIQEKHNFKIIAANV